ncbi:hypothetical protein [Enterococcus sp. 5B3_DIV0040]|uniref:hypothetical protein n=1 Tax=Enterococcus sp. 5B3_DIV0040 TaxID=1834182 RepID=UPI000B708613|nr:hypothetical protein [Enterococcus sp. 5B3_DIV0040]OTO01274.1 hypothetical protein A5883_003591 [Enterococcus sp. 5B3_DIV0040]
MLKILKLFSVLGVLLMGFSVFVSAGISVHAAEVAEEKINESQECFQPETIYQDSEGNIFTRNEVIVQKGTIDPRIQIRAPSASPISIGILWTYKNKADGNKLCNTFRKVAISDGSLGAVAGIATGGITAVLAAITAGIGGTVAKRFTEAADKIAAHPNSGKIYMYIDHVTYKKL